jgi:hypothetical protein
MGNVEHQLRNETGQSTVLFASWSFFRMRLIHECGGGDSISNRHAVYLVLHIALAQWVRQTLFRARKINGRIIG